MTGETARASSAVSMAEAHSRHWNRLVPPRALNVATGATHTTYLHPTRGVKRVSNKRLGISIQAAPAAPKAFPAPRLVGSTKWPTPQYAAKLARKARRRETERQALAAMDFGTVGGMFATALGGRFMPRFVS